MHRSKTFILAAALCLCVCLSAAALTNGPLGELWESGCEFLFHTDNVTVSGEAVFSLDGERFKTAKLNYIQDGYSSYYGLQLLTPRKNGTELESGWTIVSDEEGFCSVIEAYEPGVYHWATCTPQNTLLRRTVRLDALTELGGLLIGQMETLLPEDAVAVTEAEGTKKFHIVLAEGQIPDTAASALNLAACYLSSRWFSFGYDRTVSGDASMPFDHYVTPTEALMGGTLRWTLQSADAEFVLDEQGRLTAVNGKVKAASNFWDGSVREVEVEFNLSATDYGASYVKPFDPADYGVEKAYAWDEEENENAAFPEEEAMQEPIWPQTTRSSDEPPKTITAMASEIDPEHITSVTVNARIVDCAPDAKELTLEVFVPEVFAREDVLSLAVGDAIYTQGREIVIRTLYPYYGYMVAVNESEDAYSDDSLWLVELANGNFSISNGEDNGWIKLAELTVPVRDSLLFLDHIDPATGDIREMPAVHTAAELLAMVKTESGEGGPGFAADNVYAVFDEAGQLALVERYYVPWQ